MSPPIEAVLREIRHLGAADGRPKVHLSSPARGAPVGAHADYVRAADLLAFMKVAPHAPFDCMLETKQKDRALLRLRQQLERMGVRECDRVWGRGSGRRTNERSGSRLRGEGQTNDELTPFS